MNNDINENPNIQQTQLGENNKSKSKKLIIIIVSILLLVAVGIAAYFYFGGKKDSNPISQVNPKDNKENQTVSNVGDFNLEYEDANFIFTADKNFNVFSFLDNKNVKQTSVKYLDDEEEETKNYSSIKIVNNTIQVEWTIDEENKRKETITSISDPVAVTTYFDVQGTVHFGVVNSDGKFYFIRVDGLDSKSKYKLQEVLAPEEIVGVLNATSEEIPYYAAKEGYSEDIFVKSVSGNYYFVEYDLTLTPVEDINSLILLNSFGPKFILSSSTKEKMYVGYDDSLPNKYLEYNDKVFEVKNVFYGKSGFIITNSNNEIYTLNYNKDKKTYEIIKYNDLIVKKITAEKDKVVVEYTNNTKEEFKPELKDEKYNYIYVNEKIVECSY